MKKKYVFCVMMLYAALITISCEKDDPIPTVNPLTAMAGNDTTTSVGTKIYLNGGASSDAEGGSLTWSWTIQSKPAGSEVFLKNTHTANPEIIPDVAGVYVIKLAIRRDKWSSTDEVRITVFEAADPQLVIISTDIVSDMVLEDIFTGDWTKVDYLITAPIKLEANLTIKPGVKIAFAKNAGLTVTPDGTLISEGGNSEEKRVYLTGQTETPGYWMGVFLRSGNLANKMTNTSLAYAGANTSLYPLQAGMWMDNGSKISIEHSFFIHNAGFGLYVSPEADLTSFFSNYFKNEVTGGHVLALPSREVKNISHDNQFWNGDIAVTTAGISDGKQAEWGVFTYTLMEGLEVTNGSGLLLSDGTKLRVAQDKRIALLNGGYISAKGVEARPVVIKGIEEDIDGYWKGVFIEQSANNPSSFEYVSIWNAGSSPLTGSQPASIHLGQNGKAFIDYTAVNYGAGDGIEATSDGAALLSFKFNTIRAHRGYPIAVSTRNVAVIHDSTYFVNNTLNKVRIDGNYPIANDQETVWKGFVQQNMSYYVQGLGEDLVIWSGLKLEPGVVVEMEPEARIVVEDANERQGYLHAAGTASKNVIFKSVSNIAGSWHGITISSTNDKNHFTYTQVLHGGKKVENNFSANITIDNSPEGQLTIENSLIGYSGQHGIAVLNDKRINLAERNLDFIGIPENAIHAW